MLLSRWWNTTQLYLCTGPSAGSPSSCVVFLRSSLPSPLSICVLEHAAGNAPHPAAAQLPSLQSLRAGGEAAVQGPQTRDALQPAGTLLGRLQTVHQPAGIFLGRLVTRRQHPAAGSNAEGSSISLILRHLSIHLVSLFSSNSLWMGRRTELRMSTHAACPFSSQLSVIPL